MEMAILPIDLDGVSQMAIKVDDNRLIDKGIVFFQWVINRFKFNI